MKKHIFKILLMILMSLGGLAIASGGIFIYSLITSFAELAKPIEDVSQYREIRESLDTYSQQVKHFPNQIPSNAKNLGLYYTPGHLQGGAIFQIRMQLPADEIKTLQSQFRKIAKRKYIPGSQNNSPKSETIPSGENISFNYNLYAGESETKEFPPDYEILVLEDTRGAPKYDWNHSNLYGVAINVSNHEIVYWMEDW
jgi:hypothetical protein